MILTFRPIKVWPDGWRDPHRSRTGSPFSATYSDTLNLLERELAHLGVTEATLQVAADDRGVRLDGQLRADAKVSHPGVILTLETKKHGTLVYACDRFETAWGKPAWQANLRAIALGLEALRKVERYGIAERGQQYAGYRELPPGIAMGAAMTVEQAAKIIAEATEGKFPADDLLEDHPLFETVLQDAYRLAAKRLHPDAGGDPEAFRRLTEARDLLLREVRS